MNEKINDKNLDAIYAYLSLFFNSMDNDEKKFWINTINTLDPENYEN